jgi:hypothetical protein
MMGWLCPNCGKAHGPDVATCPEPAGANLRPSEKMKRANMPKRISLGDGVWRMHEDSIR